MLLLKRANRSVWYHGELLMLSSGAAIVGGLFIGSQSSNKGADPSSQIGTWCGSLVLELLAVVPLLCAMPALFHELAHSRLLHAVAPGTIDVALGASELLPMVAILPFMLYQLAGFGTLDYSCRNRRIGHQHRRSRLDIRQLYIEPQSRIRHGKKVRRPLVVAMGITCSMA